MTINGIYIPNVKTEDEFWAELAKWKKEEQERNKLIIAYATENNLKQGTWTDENGKRWCTTFKVTNGTVTHKTEEVKPIDFMDILTPELNTSDIAFKCGMDYEELVANKL